MTVVEDVQLPEREIDLDTAKEHGLEAELGEELGFQVFWHPRNADRAKQLHAAPFRGDAIKFEMLLKRFDQLGADGQDGIERGHRVLEYDRERPAAKFA